MLCVTEGKRSIFSPPSGALQMGWIDISFPTKPTASTSYFLYTYRTLTILTFQPSRPRLHLYFPDPSLDPVSLNPNVVKMSAPRADGAPPAAGDAVSNISSFKIIDGTLREAELMAQGSFDTETKIKMYSLLLFLKCPMVD